MNVRLVSASLKEERSNIELPWDLIIKIVRKWYACSSIFAGGSSIPRLDDWLTSNLTSAYNEIIGGSRNCALLFCSFPANRPWCIRIVVIRRHRRTSRNNDENFSTLALFRNRSNGHENQSSHCSFKRE